MGDDLARRLHTWVAGVPGGGPGVPGRLWADPAALGAFEWFGFRDVRSWRRRWERLLASDSRPLITARWPASAPASSSLHSTLARL